MLRAFETDLVRTLRGVEKCRRKAQRALRFADGGATAAPFAMLTPNQATAAFVAARCAACGRCEDMPPVMPHTLLGTRPRGGAFPPPLPAH